jgi:hypothetical protein
MPAVESTRPFLSLLIEGGTLILLDDSPYELEGLSRREPARRLVDPMQLRRRSGDRRLHGSEPRKASS